MSSQLNTNNPAIRRILSELKKLQADPSDDFEAHPVEENLFDWHFVLRGPSDTPFAGGLYHGRIILPSQYPHKPPEFMFLCPQGRFEVGKKICLSISQHHPELWQPGWDIRTALTAIQSFMPTPGNGAIAALDYSDEERRKLAEKSKENSAASLRTHGMLEAFQDFLQRAHTSPAGSSPAAAGGRGAASAAAAAPAATPSVQEGREAQEGPAAPSAVRQEGAPSAAGMGGRDGARHGESAGEEGGSCVTPAAESAAVAPPASSSPAAVQRTGVQRNEARPPQHTMGRAPARAEVPRAVRTHRQRLTRVEGHNVPPPSEDELFLNSVIRFLLSCIFVLVLRRAIMMAYPQVDWREVIESLWKELVDWMQHCTNVISEYQEGGRRAGREL